MKQFKFLPENGWLMEFIDGKWEKHAHLWEDFIITGGERSWDCSGCGALRFDNPIYDE